MAHNAAGVGAAARCARILLLLPAKRGEGRGEGQREKLALIIGFLGDKDWRPMCEIPRPTGGKNFHRSRRG